MSLQDWINESTPDRREVVVCFDRRLLSALVVAKDALEEANATTSGMLGGPADPELEAAVADLEAKVREKERKFVFEGIGWGPWRDLVGKHPPTQDQAETFERAVKLGFMPHAVENIAWNAETFIPAAMAASCIDPGMTVQQGATMLRQAPPGVIDRLWAAVVTVNLAGGDDPLVGPVSLAASDGQIASAKR